MSREDKNRIGYTVALVTEFSKRFDIRQNQAYAYLKRYKGLEHFVQHYGVLHTLSFTDTIDVLTEVCINNGGQLK